ncbi:hypothetical protein MMC29_006437 [Sticta canariensis]|nr:hypothetical protein [Sticta canariensis]
MATGIELVDFLLIYQAYTYFYRPLGYVRLYGISGAVVAVFGSRNIWEMQAEVLGSLNDETAMAFRKSVQDESTTSSVAGAIVAQIAITALSLPYLSQTHWVAQGFWIFSLISALMAVYYTSTLHRTLGRLLLPGQVKGWIRGEKLQKPDVTGTIYEDLASLEEKDFLPCLNSVLTMSAPQLLLSSSLYSFLIGLGVYLSFISRRQLNPDSGFNDSENIFITYLISIATCQIIYTLSSVAQDVQRNENPWRTVHVNWNNFHAKAREENNRNQSLIQQNPIEGEQSRQFSLTHPSQTLIKALQDSARLRRESAKVEELIARCYEKLLDDHQAVETNDEK